MVMYISPSEIKRQIKARKLTIAVIGLGQVGLPTALHFATTGASVIGMDIDGQKVEAMHQGYCPLDTSTVVDTFSKINGNGHFRVTREIVEAIRDSDIHILCLPTPLTERNKPNISAIVNVCKQVGSSLKKGNLVILESTVYPGVTSKIVKPILEESSGLKAGEDFGLSYCFERIDPGNSVHRVDNTPKVVSGINEKSADAAIGVYSVIIDAPLVKVRNCETAEMVKLVENVFRDINIAYVNQISLLCERLNIDILAVLETASGKWSFLPHIPGAGVGGACIPVNPYYLMKCAEEVGLDLTIVREARQINDSMPYHMVTLVKEAFEKIGRPIKDSKICIFGLSYKADIGDTNIAPAVTIATELERLAAKIVVYDPLVTRAPQNIDLISSLGEATRDSDCLVFTSDHSCFKSLDLETIAKLTHTPFAIVDGRHVFAPREVSALGITYIGLGRNQDSTLNIWNAKLKSNNGNKLKSNNGKRSVKHGTVQKT